MSEQQQVPAGLTLEDLQRTASAFQQSRILLTAFELGLFTALGEGPRTSGEVAAELHLDARALDRLMRALVAVGLLRRQTDGRFVNAPAVDAHLIEGRPGYLSGLGHTVHLWDAWGRLTQAVRTGHAPATGGLQIRDPEWLRSFIQAMHARASATATDLVALIDLQAVRRVLDVGGGSGVYSMAFARVRRDLRATVFDLPEVVPLTRQYVEQEGLADRVDAVAGDYTQDPLPAGHDLVFLSAILHSNSAPQNAELIRKCAASLEPSGRVVIVDFIMEEDRCTPPHGALFALNMLVNTPAGDTYTRSEIRGWMEAAGLEDVTSRGTPFGTTLMVGRAPSETRPRQPL